ncbi:MAG: ribosomal protein S18-alanine N-acetyltransferase [Desulfarculales bacterium]|jgi:ribosomal-protein-alanine N-acetyltransferase|nr:ribosomal protein S18-alanine N-acetyltransferase [Desulfarculales bacterium]
MIEDILAIERVSFSSPWPREIFAAELGHSHSLALGADWEGRGGCLAAYIFLWLIADEAQIHTVAVHPALRGKGVASYLLKFSLRCARFRGARWASLEVRGSNSAARRLYEKLGFKLVGRRPAYYRDPSEDALLMNGCLGKM